MDFPASLHSVSYSGSWGQARLSVEEFIDKAAGLGFQGVMLMAKRPHLSLLDWSPQQRRQLRLRLERRGLRQVCVAAYNNFTADWEHQDVPHLEIQIGYITELAKLTADLGGGLLRIFTGYEHPRAGFAAQWQHVTRGVRECAERAAEWGVTIGVQNHHDIATGYEAQLELIRTVNQPNCRAMFDAWAPALHGTDLAVAARAMAPVSCHTTVANYQRLPRYHYLTGLTNYAPAEPFLQAVPVDEGIIDYSEFFKALYSAGFRGSVAYEMCSHLRGGGSMENLDLYASRFIDFMARLRPELEASAALESVR